MPVVTNLFSYPVKGCAGTALTEAELTPAGLAHDRTFMVVDEDGVYRTQRRHPRLAAVRPTVSADGTRLTLAPADPADRHGGVTAEVTTTAPRRDVDLFGAAFQGIDQGEGAAAWLSDFLGAPSRLVRVPPEHRRITDGVHPGPSGYADSSAVHLIARSSLALLNLRLAARGHPPLAMDRFRPNIVIGPRPGGRPDDDWAALPHTEDRARRLTAGAAALGHTKLAVRCAVTLVDQRAGARRGPEPLRTLADYRRAPSGGVVFGTKFSVLRTGKLSVGDEVDVYEWDGPAP
ncbi:MOSC domain-containing protein [Streptomyces sp. ODS05-4]|uniref:MOSC domain-containing protein n=1 Tax=Streptomyces sp. ODS05-4 TaxID=2944939 RepID=UPI00210AF4AB|nr:MOSC N-terminal beta barrel domain-containing protein [Streptomyces sp. ODS05-4]